MPRLTRKVGRSAKSGQFVSKGEVQCNPNETVMDTVPVRSKKRDLIDEMKTLTVDLNFQSETDRLVDVFVATGITCPVTVEMMESLTGLTLNEPPHYTFDYWLDKNSNPEVQPDASRYKDIKAWMVENLIERQVFRMTGGDDFNLTYFAVGVDLRGNLIGLAAEGTET